MRVSVSASSIALNILMGKSLFPIMVLAKCCFVPMNTFLVSSMFKYFVSFSSFQALYVDSINSVCVKALFIVSEADIFPRVLSDF